MKLTGDRQVALGKLAATTKERQAARDLKMKTSALKFRLRNKNKNFTPVKAIEGEPPRGAVSETRSAANRRRSTKRKEDADREKREKTGKSGHAYAYGKKSSKEFGKAKIRRSAADELESYAKTNPGSNPSRRKDAKHIAISRNETDTKTQAQNDRWEKLKNRSSVSETRSEKNRKRVTLRKTGEKKLRKLKIAKTKPNPYSGPDPMRRSVKEAEAGTMNQLFLAELKKRLSQTTTVQPKSRFTPVKPPPTRKLPGWAKRGN